MKKIKMSNLARDLTAPCKDTDTIGGLRKKFTRIMKKHGIKARIQPDRGSDMLPNLMYNVYRNAFIKGVMDSLTFGMVMDSMKWRSPHESK